MAQKCYSSWDSTLNWVTKFDLGQWLGVHVDVAEQLIAELQKEAACFALCRVARREVESPRVACGGGSRQHFNFTTHTGQACIGRAQVV